MNEFNNNNANAANGVFINGKAQIAEMLPLLTQEERSRLLKNIRARNSQLADELQAESITFKSILDLDEQDVLTVLQYIKPQIMGIALRALPYNGKKKVLTLADRNYAEQAYQTMSARLNDEKKGIESACLKVKQTMMTLAQANRISFS